MYEKQKNHIILQNHSFSSNNNWIKITFNWIILFIFVFLFKKNAVNTKKCKSIFKKCKEKWVVFT